MARDGISSATSSIPSRCRGQLQRGVGKSASACGSRGAGDPACRSVTSCSPDPVSGIDSLVRHLGLIDDECWAVGSHGKIISSTALSGRRWRRRHRIASYASGKQRRRTFGRVGDSSSCTTMVHRGRFDDRGEQKIFQGAAASSPGHPTHSNLVCGAIGARELYVSTCWARSITGTAYFWTQ